MNHKFGKRALLLAAIAILILLTGGAFYLSRTQKTLWEQSVSNVLEVTTQGGKSFEVFVDQGCTMLEGRAANFELFKSTDAESIVKKLDLYEYGDFSFTTLDLTHGMLYFNSKESMPLSDEQIEEYLSLHDHGVLEPFKGEYTGRQVMGYYERFNFADGAEGMVRKTVPVSEISERFALSFYDGKGFTYVVNANGDVMFRSDSKNNSDSFQNIFDAAAFDGNSAGDIDSLRANMSDRKKDVMRLDFNGKEHIFAFVPLNVNNGWYLVSIIPDSVIMEHANKIIMSSQVMIGGIAIAMFIFATFIILSIQHRRQVRIKDREILYREQLFNLLVENTNDVFLMLSADLEKVKYISPNTERVLGIPCKSIENDISCLQTIIHGENDKDIVMNSGIKISMYESATFEGNYTHNGTGETRWYKENIYHNMIDNEERYIIILADSTDERQKEAALTEALHIAEVANESKSTFLANMSHDIRTPMNAIVGLATLIQRDAEIPEKVREHTEKITSSSQHLMGLINDVLDMSKIETGKTSLNISEFSLAKLVQELDSIIRLQSKAKKQTFDIVVQDIKNENLIGDKQRISQVLINILSNAVKYTPNGGRVTLTVHQLGQVTQDIVRIRFEVADNGIGMSEDYQKVIFQPFTREVRTTVNQIQGTGLGMAITKNLIDLMGGTISVKSAQGVGSTFTIDLDLRAQVYEDDTDFWKEHNISNALIVDDEADTCTEILSAMSGTGVAMQFASDGSTAVKMAQMANRNNRDFDLILLDWKMPGMDGLETARQIRAKVPAHIPIMILTAYDCEDIREEGIAAGIDGFLSKPFFISNLKEVICSITKAEQPDDTHHDNNSVAGRRFLCAEDNELNAEILIELLDMEGAKADVAVDGQEAVKMFSSAPEGTYDAILMDIQMPIMNGHEAAQAIRKLEHPQAASIPIIAMTANAFVDDVNAALDSGMNAHLAKPVDMKKLVELLIKLCKK